MRVVADSGGRALLFSNPAGIDLEWGAEIDLGDKVVIDGAQRGCAGSSRGWGNSLCGGDAYGDRQQRQSKRQASKAYHEATPFLALARGSGRIWQ